MPELLNAVAVVRELVRLGDTRFDQRRFDEALFAYLAAVVRFDDLRADAWLGEELDRATRSIGPSAQHVPMLISVVEAQRPSPVRSPELDLQRYLAWCLIRAGRILGDLGRVESQVAAYDALVDRFVTGDDREITRRVAWALYYKGRARYDQSRFEDAINSLDVLIARFSNTSDPKLQEPVIFALWDKVLALISLQRSQEALTTMTDLRARESSIATDHEWQRSVELTELDLLYAVGRFDDLLRVAEKDTDVWLADGGVGPEQLVDALWLRRLAEHRLGVEPQATVRDAIRRRLISDPDAATRGVAAEATSRALWRAVEAHDAAAVLDTVSELEDAFDSESDPNAQLRLGELLLLAGDWLASVSTELPGSLPRAVLLARTVVKRFERSTSEPDLRLLAEASWEEYKALGAMNEPEQQEPAVERMLELGAITAQMLGDELAEQETRDASDPDVRAYILAILMMRALAIGAGTGQWEEAISLLASAIDR